MSRRKQKCKDEMPSYVADLVFSGLSDSIDQLISVIESDEYQWNDYYDMKELDDIKKTLIWYRKNYSTSGLLEVKYVKLLDMLLKK